MLVRFLNESFFFQVNVTAPQVKFGEIPLLAPVQPVLPTLPTGPWGSGLDVETNASGVGLLAPSTDVAPVRSTVSVSAAVQFESSTPTQSPVPAQIQTSVPVSAQAAAIPDPPSSTLIKAQTSAPVAPTLGHTHAKAPFETSKISSTTSDAPSKISEAKSAQSAAASVPVSGLQPAGIQTKLPECASLTANQQNLESTTASISLQQEPCAEVGTKTCQTSLNRLLLSWTQNKHMRTKMSFAFLLPLHKVITPLHCEMHVYACLSACSPPDIGVLCLDFNE